MPVSEAKKRAKLKFDKKAYDSIMLRVKKGQHELFKDYAHKNGESLNGFIVDAVLRKIQAIEEKDEAEVRSET